MPCRPEPRAYGLVWKPPATLPNPRSVTLGGIRELRLGNLPKVAAVLTDATHPLFMRCVFVTATMPSAIGMATPDGLLPILIAAIDALPTGLSQRQAGITASLLAFALMRWEDKTGQVPQGQELARTMQQLLQHGVLNPTTTVPVTPDELNADGQEFLELFEEPTSCFPGNALPACWRTPRCVTLAGLCMNTMISSVDTPLMQQVADGLPRELWTDELLEELMDMSVDAYSGCMIAPGILWLLRYPGATAWLEQALLQRPERLERCIMAVPGKLLAALKAAADSPASAKDRILRAKHIHLWALQLVRLYNYAFAERLGPGPGPTPPQLPAPLFLIRLLGALLAVYRDDRGLPPSSGAPGSRRGALHTSSSNPPVDTLRQDLFAQQSQVAPGPGVGLVLVKCLFDLLRREDMLTAAVADGVVLQMLELAVKLKDQQSAVTLAECLVRPVMCATEPPPPDRLVGSATQAADAPAAARRASPVEPAPLHRTPPFFEVLRAQVTDAIVSGRSELLDDLLKEDCPKKLKGYIGYFVLVSLPADTPAFEKTLSRMLSGLVLPVITEHGSLQHCDASTREQAASLLLDCPYAALTSWSSVELAAEVQHMLLDVLWEAWCFQTFQACMPALAALADLVSPNCKLPKAERLEFQKEVLWRVGCAIQDICARSCFDANLLPPVPCSSMWRFVASLTKHQMSGKQLQKLHHTMRATQYRSPQTAGKLDAFIEQCCKGNVGRQSHTAIGTNDIILAFIPRYLACMASSGFSRIPGDPGDLCLNFLQPATSVLVSLAAQDHSGAPSCSPAAVLRAAVSVLLATEQLPGLLMQLRAAQWPGVIGEAEESRLVQLLEADGSAEDTLAALAWLVLRLRGAHLQHVQVLLDSPRLWIAVGKLLHKEGTVMELAFAIVRDIGVFFLRAVPHQAKQLDAGPEGACSRSGINVEETGQPAAVAAVSKAECWAFVERMMRGRIMAEAGLGEGQVWRLPVAMEAVEVLKGCWWCLWWAPVPAGGSSAHVGDSDGERGTSTNGNADGEQLARSANGNSNREQRSSCASGSGDGDGERCTGSANSSSDGEWCAGSANSRSDGERCAGSANGGGVARRRASSASGKGVDPAQHTGRGGGAGTRPDELHQRGRGSEASTSEAVRHGGEDRCDAAEGVRHAGSGGRASSSAAARHGRPGSKASTSTGVQHGRNASDAGTNAGHVQHAGRRDAGSARADVQHTSETSAAGSSEEEVRQCVVCGAQPLQTHLCSMCKSARYCGAECQRADWKKHKKVCKQLQAAAAAADAAAVDAAATGSAAAGSAATASAATASAATG